MEEEEAVNELTGEAEPATRKRSVLRRIVRIAIAAVVSLAVLILLRLFGFYALFDKIEQFFVTQTGIEVWLARAAALLMLAAALFFPWPVLFLPWRGRVRVRLSLLLVGFAGIMVALHFATAGVHFDRRTGKAVKFYIVTLQGCKTSWSGGFDTELGTSYIPLTPEGKRQCELWQEHGPNFRIGPEPCPTFFNVVTGDETCWFARLPNGEWAFSPVPGIHPGFGIVLQPMSKEAAEDYYEWKAERDEQARKQAEIKKQEEEERARAEAEAAKPKERIVYVLKSAPSVEETSEPERTPPLSKREFSAGSSAKTISPKPAPEEVELMAFGLRNAVYPSAVRFVRATQHGPATQVTVAVTNLSDKILSYALFYYQIIGSQSYDSYTLMDESGKSIKASYIDGTDETGSGRMFGKQACLTVPPGMSAEFTLGFEGQPRPGRLVVYHVRGSSSLGLARCQGTTVALPEFTVSGYLARKDQQVGAVRE